MGSGRGGPEVVPRACFNAGFALADLLGAMKVGAVLEDEALAEEFGGVGKGGFLLWVGSARFRGIAMLAL